MTTANEIIAESLGKLGLIGAGETVDGDNAGYCLITLNTVVDALNLPSDFAYVDTNVSATLNTGVATLSIGPAQALNTVRPVRIELGSYATISGVDYPMISISEQEFNQIPIKTNGGTTPMWFWYEPGVTNGTIHYYPLPGATCVVTHPVQKQTSAFADLTTQYTLPTGLRRCLVNLLAVEVAPAFEREAPPSVIATAANALRLFKRSNAVVPVLDMPYGIPGTNRWRDGWSL
jgi:hypothetical protein